MLTYYNIFGLVLAYLIGSIPSSVWIGKIFYGIDVREHGSGNAGATNTLRVLGTKPGIAVLVFDAFKGWFAVKLSYFLGNNFDYESFAFANFQISLAFFVLMGHVFPIYAGFKGGKGIATLLGIALAIFNEITLISAGIFVVVFILTRYVSLGSIITALTFPVLVIWIFRIDTPSLIVFSCIVAVFVPITHKKNIKRLFKGEELKTIFTKKGSINK